jgi:thioredoxin reductase (NADPH)
MELNELLDCVIIGGGPAGLTAGIYLARYRRKAMIFDGENSRAAKIPLSHNYPGFPQGISGNALLEKLREQLSHYHLPIMKDVVHSVKQINQEQFLIQAKDAQVYAKNIILATGVEDIEPHLADVNDALQKGLIRHCPVCDAFEVIDKKIAVIGHGKAGLGEAFFLRDYTPHITLMTLGKEDNWTSKDLKNIQQAQISLISQDIKAIEFYSNYTRITLLDSRIVEFDGLYSALGCINNNQIATELNLKMKEGCLIVDKHQQTSMKGVYAAGDIVSGLNQICVATGQAAIAATAVHNHCRPFKSS